ncbi:hypothetical protein PF008_g23745 [Phytophthora fragariae]|uniref:Uncharacterized protein n=2 Tax=Phytophthora fragariae TaxID=53985 RepID=A0A6G0QQ23_9STRA|nr:hypothetical protein PF008_g23745 [Phytophthora fragariae]
MGLPLPESLSVMLTLKVGTPFGTSRTSYGAPQHLQFELEDGYLGFHARVRRLVEKVKVIEWQEGSPILLKSTISASQAKFVMLAEPNQELLVQLTSGWFLAAKRKMGQASFKLELFIYVSRVAASATIRRATEGRIVAAASLIDEHLSALPGEQQLGEASRAHWVVTHARQPKQTPLAIPTNPTFTQLRRIDDYQREASSAPLRQSLSRLGAVSTVVWFRST